MVTLSFLESDYLFAGFWVFLVYVVCTYFVGKEFHGEHIVFYNWKKNLLMYLVGVLVGVGMVWLLGYLFS